MSKRKGSINASSVKSSISLPNRQPDQDGHRKIGLPQHRIKKRGEQPFRDHFQHSIPECVQLSFPTMEIGCTRHKLFGVVTNRKIPGPELIRWRRERCGKKSEEVHSIIKEDLAGGKPPSGNFGENAAWRAIMILALNLNAAMRRLVLPKEWASKRFKAIRRTPA